MKLHYIRTMNPRKACATAKHLGLPLEYVEIDVKAGALRSPEYLALNPNGLAPVLIDGSKTIWESAAIAVYLASRAGSDMWPARDVDKQVEVLRWISWDASHFAPQVGTWYFENYIKRQFGFGSPDPAKLAAAEGPFHDAARVLNGHLADRPYVAGSNLTVADFCVAAMLPYADEIELPLTEYKHIRRWHDGLMQLEAWRDPWPSA